jgi:hypothetical protein
MNLFDSIKIIFNRLSGATARRSRALRHANDFTEAIKKFLTSYDQYENVDVNQFLEKSSEIKFDVSVLVHSGRSVARQAGSLKNKPAVLLIDEIVENMESVRRYLFSPSAQKDKLRQALIKLRTSGEELQKNIAEIKRQ